MYKCVAFRATLNSPKMEGVDPIGKQVAKSTEGGEASREVSSGWDCLKAHYGVLVDL